MGKLNIATTGKTQKKTFIGDNGELQGARIGLWTKLAADLGLEAEFVRVDWLGMLAGVQAGSFDMVASSVSRRPKRITSANFHARQAFNAIGAGAALHADTTDIAN